jgi:hypothetical protein
MLLLTKFYYIINNYELKIAHVMNKGGDALLTCKMIKLKGGDVQ